MERIKYEQRKYTVIELVNRLLTLPNLNAEVDLVGCDCGGDNIWIEYDGKEVSMGYTDY